METMILSNRGDFNHYSVLVEYSAMSDRMVIISPFLSPDMPGFLADMPLGNKNRSVKKEYTVIDDNYIGFSEKRLDILEGDLFICHAVKAGNVLGICRVLENGQKELAAFEGDHWNYKFKTECITEKYSRHWWDYDLKTF